MALGATTIRRESIAYGDAGAMQTVNRIAGMIRASREVPAVVFTARRIVAPVESRDQRVIAFAIARWLKSVWKFVDDPTEQELLVTPERALAFLQEAGYIAGDCDESAALGGALAAAVGLYPLLNVWAFIDPDTGEDRLAHVFTSVLTDTGDEVNLDPTRPRGPMPQATREVTVSVF